MHAIFASTLPSSRALRVLRCSPLVLDCRCSYAAVSELCPESRVASGALKVGRQELLVQLFRERIRRAALTVSICHGIANKNAACRDGRAEAELTKRIHERDEQTVRFRHLSVAFRPRLSHFWRNCAQERVIVAQVVLCLFLCLEKIGHLATLCLVSFFVLRTKENTGRRGSNAQLDVGRWIGRAGKKLASCSDTCSGQVLSYRIETSFGQVNAVIPLPRNLGVEHIM